MSELVRGFEAPQEDPKNPIFAAAIEFFDENGQITHGTTVHTHAPDQATAECSFRAMYSKQLMANRVRIVGVALAVGWFCDDHGENLSD
jgi:hypothetical protein